MSVDAEDEHGETIDRQDQILAELAAIDARLGRIEAELGAKV